MAKSHSDNKSSQKYLAEKRRIKNKERKIQKRLKNIVNEQSKEAIIKSCRIGRAKEGDEFKKKQDFKCKKPIVKIIELPKIMNECTDILKNQPIKRNGYDTYYCKQVRTFVAYKNCKSCQKNKQK